MLREPEEWARLWALAIIHHAEGHRAESDTALQALIAKYQDGAAYQVAQVYAARSELELAFQWLERAYDQRDPGVAEMKCEPLLRSLHADPRWEAFLRKMGLADWAKLASCRAVARPVTIDRYVQHQRLECTAVVGRSRKLANVRFSKCMKRYERS